MSPVEQQLRALIESVVREVLAETKAKEAKRRNARPCGRGNREPQCMGSAVHGPDGCTCPGVRVEFY